MKTPKYIQFWWDSIHEFGLSPTQALLLHLIDGLSVKSGACHASKAYMAKALGVSKWAIYDALKILEVKGLIRRRPNTYSGRVNLISTTAKWDDYKIGVKESLNGHI